MRINIGGWVVISLFLARINAAEFPLPVWRPQNVDTNIMIGYGLAIADVDGDRKKDILLADKNLIVWYQNPTWQKHVIASNLTKLDHVCIAAADIDGDGKAEVAAGAGWNPSDTTNSGAVFYLHPRADRTQPWEPIALEHEPTVHRMRWIQLDSGKPALAMLPLHGRENKGGEGNGVRLLVYEKPADPKAKWNVTTIETSMHMTHNFDPVQWDDRPSTELLIGGREGVFFFDLQRDGWLKQQVCGNNPGEKDFIGAGEVRQGRMGGKPGFIATIEPMHGNQFVIYTPPSEPNRLWKRTVLDSSLVDGHAVACGDLAGKGYDQVVVGWRGRRPGESIGVKYFYSDEKAGNWKSAVIDDKEMACEDLMLADLNEDGRLDIVAAGRSTKNVRIYWNEK
ncbi:MAG: FG-GAP and VCBS repeat-containing protein [Verrucomicrobiota bacterium]|nr:FG-GAP and VCBS repeat-containing protein [Verrucomicrobiota bacterium]